MLKALALAVVAVGYFAVFGLVTPRMEAGTPNHILEARLLEAEKREADLKRQVSEIGRKLESSRTYVCATYGETPYSGHPVIRFKNNRAYSGEILFDPISRKPVRGESVKLEWFDREGAIIISVDYTRCP